MKRLHFIFGLTILVMALTLTMMILGKPRERGGSADDHGWAGRMFDDTPARPGPDRKSVTARPEPPEVGVRSGDPQLMERAKEVEAAARKRLVALSDELSLTRAQQARIFPLLARSAPTYDESLEIVGGDGGRGRLTREDAEAGIHEVLDADQQAELIESIAEKDLWWADLMARLEDDLARSTGPENPRPAAGGSEDEAEGGTVEPNSHRSGNIFDLMNNEGR